MQGEGADGRWIAALCRGAEDCGGMVGEAHQSQPVLFAIDNLLTPIPKIYKKNVILERLLSEDGIVEMNGFVFGGGGET